MENERGGRGGEWSKTEPQDDVEFKFIDGVRDHQGGRHFLPGRHPTPTNFKYYQKHRLGRENPQATGLLVRQSQGRPTIHWWSQLEAGGQ